MSAAPTTYVGSLTDEELAALDGKCRAEVQTKVEDAKRRLADRTQFADLTPAEAAFISDVVAAAKDNGGLTYRYEQINSCTICGASPGYAKLTRTSRRGRRGDIDTRHRLTLSGVELRAGFVHFQGSVRLGGCRDCLRRLAPRLAVALATVDAEIPEGLTGQPPRFKRHDRRECPECGWTGGENEMGRLPALFEGSYPGVCPKCGWRHEVFGKPFKSAPGFTLVPLPSPAQPRPSESPDAGAGT